LSINGGTGLWQDSSAFLMNTGLIIEWNADAVLDATNALTYSITSQTVAGAFAIDASTGVITVANGNLLDYETNAIHTLTVRVSDGAGNTYDEAFTVSLTDLAEFNNAPTNLSSGIELNTDGGNNAYLMTSNGGAILGGVQELTLEFMFAVDTVQTENTLFSYAVTGQSNEIFLMIRSSGQLQFNIESTNLLSSGNYLELLDGNLRRLAVSWDRSSGAVSFYVDGQLKETFTGFRVNTVIDSGGTITLGQEQDSVNGGFQVDQRFSGTLYDVRIWNQVRSAAEIELNYQHKFAPGSLPTGLVANWQMDGFNGSNQVVDVVSGNNLSIGHVPGSATSITSWLNQVGGATASVDTITYVDDGQIGWSSQVNSSTFSSLGFTDNYTVAFTLDNTTNYAFMIGLGVTESDTSYTDIDHAIYFDHTFGQLVGVYQNGTNIGTYSVNVNAGDEFSFYVNGTTIEYQNNGVTFYTATGVTAGTNWYLDSSFYAGTGSWENQTDYSLSNFRVFSGNIEPSDTGFIASTPREDLHISENSVNGTRVGFVVPSDPDVSNDIVRDGLFTEAADPTTFTTYTTGQAIGNWTVAGTGSVHLHNANGVYQDETPLGGNAVHLQAGGDFAIQQTLTTEVGKQYQIVFAGSGLWDTAGVKQLRVSAGGESADFVYGSAPPNYNFANSIVWEHRSFTFTANDTTTVLRFADNSNYVGQGTLLADIRVIEIPAAVNVILNNDPTLSYDAATGKFYRVVNSATTWSAAQIAAVSAAMAALT
jgi:hypothetical protein